MSLHIGIVACSAEGAALCYRTICLEGAELLGPHHHPEISMHGHDFADYVKCIDGNDWVGVAELMLSSAEKLAKTGADFLLPSTPCIKLSTWSSTVRRVPGCTLPSRSRARPSAMATSAWEFWAPAR